MYFTFIKNKGRASIIIMAISTRETPRLTRKPGRHAGIFETSLDGKMANLEDLSVS